MLELDANKYKSVVLRQYNLEYGHDLDMLVSLLTYPSIIRVSCLTVLI